MIHAAILRAEEVIAPGPGCFEPFTGVLAGHDVGLDAKRRHEQIVNHVFGGHDQFDLAADGHVQFVNLALPGRVLKLPHPLLADDVNLHRVLGRTILSEINLRAPGEDAQGNQQRNHRPESFEFRRSLDRPRNLKSIATAVSNDKENDYRRNQQREENRHAGNIEIHGVHVAGNRRGTLWNEWKR